MELSAVLFYVLVYWMPGFIALSWLYVRKRKIYTWSGLVIQLLALVPVLFTYYLLMFWIDGAVYFLGVSNSVLVVVAMYSVVLLPLAITTLIVRVWKRYVKYQRHVT